MKWRWRFTRHPVSHRHGWMKNKGIPPAIKMVLVMVGFAILIITLFNIFKDDITKLLTPTPILIFILGALLFIILDNTNNRKK